MPRWRSDRWMPIYLITLHLLLWIVVVFCFRQQPWLLIGLQGLLGLSFWLGWRCWRRSDAPRQVLHQFQLLLREREFGQRISGRVYPQADAMRAEFNALLEQLQRERLHHGEQHGLLELLMAASPSAIVVLDFEGRVVMHNAQASRWLRADRCMGMKFSECAVQVPAAFHALLPITTISEPVLLSDDEGRRFRGQWQSFFDRGFRRQFLIVDELTALLAQSERAFYEKLVRVLAHEVNNTVGATHSVLQSLQFYAPQLRDADRPDFVTAIRVVSQRNQQLAAFVERFSQVVKLPEPILAAHDITRLLDELQVLMQNLARERQVQISWRRREHVPLLHFDYPLISQALLNVIKNAIEAFDGLPAEDQPDTRTRQIFFDAWVAGDSVSVAISDTANRLGDAKTEQLFSPFYTTKKDGQGLGLLLTREVLQRHHWRYRLATVDDHTRFGLEIPLSHSAAP